MRFGQRVLSGSERLQSVALAQQEVEMKLPDIRFVQIQTHSRCNADCVFCPYVESWHYENPGVMTQALWEKVLNELTPFSEGINRGKICPYLMQEPLIDKSIFQKINDIYSMFPRTLVEVSTNGAALTDQVVDQMLEVFSARRHEIWVSHHGIDEESLTRVMKIDYVKAHRNLIRLLQRSNGGLNIRIRGAGVSHAGSMSYFSRSEYQEYWKRQFEEFSINTQSVIVDAFYFHDRAGTLHRRDRDAYKCNFGVIRDIGPGHPPFRCPRIDEWLHIMYDGRIRICCMDYHGEVELPSIKDMSLVEYLQSDAYRTLVGKVTGTLESSADFICKRCISPGG
jgi:hypothetical protein